MMNLRKTLLTLSLTALSVGGLACNGGNMTDEETLVGEASSALTVAEESGDVTADAVGGESLDEVATTGDESAVLPESVTEGDGFCDLRARRDRVLARYDENGDGQLGPVERAALKNDLEARIGHPIARRFGLMHRAFVIKRVKWVFDTDLDGTLSSDERTAMVDAFEARCERIRAEVLARFDANHDGSLDATERQAAKDALIARLQAFRQQVLTRYDVNQSGVLDDTERLQLRDDRIDAFQARRAAVVDQFDVNDDGTLQDAEKIALKNAIIQRIAEGRDAE